MPLTYYKGRRTASIENDLLRITVLREGGHIAEILDKRTGINPLWMPSWASVEPSEHSLEKHPQFGQGSDAKLLAGIMGHNICLDLFGGPSPEEASAGITAHGEAAVFPYEIEEEDTGLLLTGQFPLAQLAFSRQVELRGRGLKIRETVRNLAAIDRPIGWTQHVSIGPPFLGKGKTQLGASVTRSMVYDGQFGADMRLHAGEEFAWPLAPLAGGGQVDLRIFTTAEASSEYTAHLVDPQQNHAFVTAYSPEHQLALTYLWQREEYPWLGLWQENHSRTHSPWNGDSLVLGMEFGVSPMPESKREMVGRGRLFGTPTYRWLGANGTLTAEYRVTLEQAFGVPEAVAWPEE